MTSPPSSYPPVLTSLYQMSRSAPVTPQKPQPQTSIASLSKSIASLSLLDFSVEADAKLEQMVEYSAHLCDIAKHKADKVVLDTGVDMYYVFVIFTNSKKVYNAVISSSVDALKEEVETLVRVLFKVTDIYSVHTHWAGVTEEEDLKAVARRVAADETTRAFSALSGVRTLSSDPDAVITKLSFD